MKHQEHICRFNDAPQSCECYDKGFDAAIEMVKEKVNNLCITGDNNDKREGMGYALLQVLSVLSTSSKETK